MADYTGNSIVDYLSSTGQDSSYAARAKMAAERGINNYSGTAAQNTQMLGGLRDSTTPTMPATAPVGGDFADKLTPDMKKQMTDMAAKHGLPTATEAEQWKIAQAALSPEQLTALGVDINDLVGSREAMEEQKQIYDETDAPSTTGLGVLQSALTAKTDEFNREATTPDMMAAAGITGYGALQSTMAARQKELDTRITGLQDRLLEEGDRATDVYNLALDKYKVLRDDYNVEADRMSKTVQDIIDHEQAIDLAERRAILDRETDALKDKIQSTISDPVGMPLSESRYTSSGSGASNGAGRQNPFGFIEDYSIAGSNIVDAEGVSVARVTSGFGADHTHISGETSHNGVDVVFDGGNVKALRDGTVYNTGVDPNYGGFVQVMDSEGNVMQYGHMDVDDVKAIAKGKVFNAGDYMGSHETDSKKWGTSSGSHTDIRYVGQQENTPAKTLFSIGEVQGEGQKALDDVAAAKEQIGVILDDDEYVEIFKEAIDGLNKSKAKIVIRDTLAKIFKAEDIPVPVDAKHINIVYETVQALEK